MNTAIFLLFPATSLLYFPMAFEEFENPKTWALISFSCFAFFVVNWKRILADKIAQCFLLISVSAAISTILSIDTHLSLYGNIKCPAGLLVIVSYLVLYLASRDVFTHITVAHHAISIILTCSAIVSVYAISQVLGYDFKQWYFVLKSDGYTRPISLLGHPNFLANYLAMTLPFSLWKFDNYSKWNKLAAAFIAAVSIVAIGLSLSRGMCIAAFISTSMYFILTKSNLNKTVWFYSIIGMLWAVAISISPIFKHTAVSRMTNLLEPGPARIEYPKAAIRIWEKNPWFGIGTDAFELGFQHQRSAYYWSIEKGGSAHKAHNEFLNTLATQGVFGAVCFILLAIASFMMIFRSRSPFLAPASASILAFYIAGLTSFTIVATGTIFVFCLALLRIED